MGHTQLQQIKTERGHHISATFYSPSGEMKGVIIIAPAMGVSQTYYVALSSWLTAKGYMVATFDYSGIGLSQSGHLRDTSVTITHWAKFDCAAMLEAVTIRAGGKPLYWIGHSLGGQILGLVPNVKLITKVITVACGSGYWLENVPSLKWRAWWLWYVVAPLATRLYGYFPGKRLRKVGDLPQGVMDQWRKWCLNPEYMIGVEGNNIREKYQSVKTPITSFSFTDDELMSARNIDSLHSFYTASLKKMNRISPEDVGADHIGHFGFFKPKFEQCLWEAYLLPELIPIALKS